MPVNPRLFPLGQYGGPTETMKPKAHSPAINAGSNALAVDGNGNPLTTDQRGKTRIVGGSVDIGAVEVQTGAGPSAPDSSGPGSLENAPLLAVLASAFVRTPAVSVALGSIGSVANSGWRPGQGLLPVDMFLAAPDHGLSVFPALTSGAMPVRGGHAGPAPGPCLDSWDLNPYSVAVNALS